MYTAIIQTATRALHLSLRLRKPLRRLRIGFSYTCMTVLAITGFVIFGVMYVGVNLVFEEELANVDISTQVSYLALTPTKLMYMFAGIVAAGLRKRFSPSLNPDAYDRQPLLRGTPPAAMFLFFAYCILILAMYVVWTFLSVTLSAEAGSADDLFAYARAMLFFLHVTVDALPFIAAGHLYIVAAGIRTEQFWRRTGALTVTGYTASCLFASCYYMSAYGLEIVGTIGNSPWLTGLYGLVTVILIYGFGMPAFVLLTHCAFTDSEDQYRFDFERRSKEAEFS